LTLVIPCSTRRKLAKAAGCIIEYVGKLACMAGLDEGLLSLCLPIIVYT
jgi:hypothetical protein